MSTDSSVSAPSAANGHLHRRNASIKVVKKTPGPSTISLFVSNLRLIDLDLLADWPNISISSFGTQDSRTRIKCTEYALYQLFKLYSPDVTAEKLKPFFPPLEPLQSVNLRAALFRCLNELKKSGILSKDTVLRKSMLDDCQGERFWEVCLCFSAVVLRRTSQGRKAKHARPIAEKIGTGHSLSTTQKESLLPLAIAHKSALSKALDERQRRKEKYGGLRGLLSEKEKELKQRKVVSRQQAQKAKVLQPERLATVEQAVEKSWIGSVELKEALVQGDTCAKGDGLLVESFEQLWLQDSDKGSIVSNGAEVGLLQDLSSKATQQSVRLSMWQNYLDRLVAAKPATARTSDAASEAQKAVPRFDRHRDVNLKENPKETTESSEDQIRPQSIKHRSTTRYDEILNAMREELRKNSASQASVERQKPTVQLLKRAHTQPVPPRHRNVEPVASPGAQNHHSRSPSQTAVPVGPRLGRRVSSQSKAYEKPKVDGQREPIPFKAELFSPLKENRRSLTSLVTAAADLPSPAEEEDVDIIGAQLPSNDGAAVSEQRTYIADAVSESPTIVVTNNADDVTTSLLVANSTTTTVTANDEFKIPSKPEKKERAAQRNVRPSLAERTRMSIAFNSSEDVTGFLPDLSTAESADAGGSDATAGAAAPQPPPDRRASLLERTRESISMAPTPQQAPKSKKSSHNRARSSIYPINQFETPRKARSSTININDSEKRDVTPIEQLLSPDTEYESIFKSRPRVALSPVLSPYADAELNRNLSLDSDLAVSSPLIDLGARS